LGINKNIQNKIRARLRFSVHIIYLIIKRWIIIKIFKITEILNGYRAEKDFFYKVHGYRLNLKHPNSFSEKVVWKKIYDRNPLLPITADKYKVRTYLKEKLGEKKANEILIPLLYVTDNPNKIPFDILPDCYIIKASHGSGWNIIVDGNDIPRRKIVKICWEWLRNPPFYWFRHEWLYQKIKPMIVIEELLKNKQNKIPSDFKYFMIHQECRFIQVDIDRYANHKRGIYDIRWNLIPIYYKYQSTHCVGKPKTLNAMLELSKVLSSDFDFVRVDLYSLNDKIYFGELTHYPASGLEKFEPVSFDLKLGQYWNIQSRYWKDNTRQLIF
jgi:hypothetical protein